MNSHCMLQRCFVLLLLLFSGAAEGLAQQFLGDTLFATFDSLSKPQEPLAWKEGSYDSTGKKIYPEYWYDWNKKENVLHLLISAHSCSPSFYFIELPDKTLWMNMTVSEVDNRSMPAPKKCWLYKVVDKQIVVSSSRMMDLYRAWNCNYQPGEQEIARIIGKFYLYKSQIKELRE